MSENDDNLLNNKVSNKQDLEKKWYLKFWLGLKKSLRFLKTNWLTFIVALVILFVTIVAFKGCNTDDTYQTLFNKYRKSIDDNENQIEQIRELQIKQSKEQQIKMQTYLEELNRIEIEYKKEIDRIENTKRTTRKKIVEDARRDPKTLTTKIKDTFGIPVDNTKVRTVE